MMEVPKDSIYFWMYTQGLKHVPFAKIMNACRLAGKEVRNKDIENYWNGWHNSDLYHGLGKEDVFMLTRNQKPKANAENYFDIGYLDYPLHPYLNYPEVQNRWIPCNESNKPMTKWGNGCLTIADAKAFRNQVYLAENLKGTKMIVVDCDGDHEEKLDMQTVAFLYRYATQTHALFKPKLINQYEGYEETGCTVPASFHLTFKVDRIIPTMHFPYAHIDIVGNQRNSLRYWKNKQWNGIEPAQMTSEIWNEIRKYVQYRKEKADEERHELARRAQRRSCQEEHDEG